MTYDRHDDSGKFTPIHTPEGVLGALSVLDLPATADVVDHVGCVHRTALHHMTRLEDEGRVTSRTAGRAKLWVVAEDAENA